jgi:hypothetical protein
MMGVTRLVLRSLLLTLGLLGALLAPAAAQDPPGSRELAAYRLTAPVFRQFQQASRRIGEVTATEDRFRFAPLLTREIVQSEDAASAAAQLIARLDNEPAFVEALRAADLSSREYTMFALTLVGARLAHGFIQSGALRAVPSGPPTDNVAFVGAHLQDVLDVLRALGVSA